MYGYRFLSRGFTDRREILHDSLATSQIGFSHFGGQPHGRIMGVNMTGGRFSEP